MSLIKQLLGIKHLSGGEMLWLLIAPWIVGSIYRRKTNQDIPEEVAERVASYFVTSVLVFSLVFFAAYVRHKWSDRLSEGIGLLVVVVAVYVGAIWFFGRWAVSAGLVNYGRKAKREP